MSLNRGRQQDFLSPNLDTSYRGQSEDNTSTFVFQEDEPDTIPLRPDYFSTISSNIGKDESTESLDFQRPPPSHLHDRSDTQGYSDRPIFDTSPIPSDNQGNPFSGDYEMQPQRRFTLSRYRPFASSSSEVFGDQEYGGRPDYGMFKGDEYELTIVPRSASAMGYGELDETVRDESDNEDYDYDGAPEKPPKPLFPKAAPFKAHNGHLVLDCPIAKELLSKLPDYKPDVEGGGFGREIGYMRYTAVTCGPSNFYRHGYILRQIHFSPPRETKLMIVVTMYNEDDVLLGRTLKGIFKNIKHFEEKTKSDTWGKDSWKKIVVCVVSDGRSKINERAQALLATLGVYQEGLARSVVDDNKVQAHIYEYTTRIGIKEVKDGVVKFSTEDSVPVQMLFCLKEINAKKINSHRWCFQALGQVLNPEVVILLDAGTQPAGKALYRLWKEFDRDPRVAGACGEITASVSAKQFLTNPLVYGQNFEYKISNILDKPTESLFGFISVLPGAFSGYRYIALQNDINGVGPLEKYFKGEFLHRSGELDPNDDEYEMKRAMLQQEAGIFTSNMYLAEDRILCFELVAKKGSNWLLRYCKTASAATDVPERLAEFILQRRRWLNGSFFAAIYALVHFPKVWKSSHSFGRKFFLHIEFLYQFANLVISWFSLSSYFLVFRILTLALTDPALNFAPANVFSVIFLWLYLISILTTIVLSFGNKPKGTEKFYVLIVIFFAILMVYMIFAAVFLGAHAISEISKSATTMTFSMVFLNPNFRNLIIATLSTYFLYFFASFIYLEPWHMFTSFIQYLLLSPSYVNILNIYAFCNIDDISWGTKGDTGGASLGEAKLKADGTFDVNIPVLTEEINRSYLSQLDKISEPAPPEEKETKVISEDYYAFVRSMTVLTWFITNFIIVGVVLQTGGFDQFVSAKNAEATSVNRANIFMTIILWLVAILALFRFIGCTGYLLQRLFRRDKKKNKFPTI